MFYWLTFFLSIIFFKLHSMVRKQWWQRLQYGLFCCNGQIWLTTFLDFGCQIWLFELFPGRLLNGGIQPYMAGNCLDCNWRQFRFARFWSFLVVWVFNHGQPSWMGPMGLLCPSVCPSFRLCAWIQGQFLFFESVLTQVGSTPLSGSYRSKMTEKRPIFSLHQTN